MGHTRQLFAITSVNSSGYNGGKSNGWVIEEEKRRVEETGLKVLQVPQRSTTMLALRNIPALMTIEDLVHPFIYLTTQVTSSSTYALKHCLLLAIPVVLLQVVPRLDCPAP